MSLCQYFYESLGISGCISGVVVPMETARSVHTKETSVQFVSERLNIGICKLNPCICQFLTGKRRCNFSMCMSDEETEFRSFERLWRGINRISRCRIPFWLQIFSFILYAISLEVSISTSFHRHSYILWSSAVLRKGLSVYKRGSNY